MKLYFSELDDERCYLLKDIIEDAQGLEITEIKVTEAKRITGQGFFYCPKLGYSGEVKDSGCGKSFCTDYSPRNSKNGRCRYSGYCYEPTDKKKIIKL